MYTSLDLTVRIMYSVYTILMFRYVYNYIPLQASAVPLSMTTV